MMRALFVYILLMGYCCIDAQDLIITTAKDSIHCEITKVTSNHIQLIEIINGRPEGKILDRAAVAEYYYNFSSIDIMEAEETAFNESPGQIAHSPDLPKIWSASISAGYGYQLGRIEDDLDPITRSRAREIKHGYHLTLDVHRLAHAPGGAGIKSSFFRTRNFGVTGKPLDIFTIIYAGPTGILFFKQDEQNRKSAFIDASLGLLYFQQHRKGAPDNKLTANTIGGQIGIGYDSQIFDSASLFLKASLYIGSIRTVKFKQSDYTGFFHTEWKDRYSLSRIELSAGIRF